MLVKTMGDLGVLVRSARTAAGMTQADLAARLRMSRDWVIRLEKGHPRLEAQRVLDALRVVGVSLEATLPELPANVRHNRSPGDAAQKSKKIKKVTADSPSPDPFDALFGMRKR